MSDAVRTVGGVPLEMARAIAGMPKDQVVALALLALSTLNGIAHMEHPKKRGDATACPWCAARTVMNLAGDLTGTPTDDRRGQVN